ncbi:MAG TPA: hypothetical protein VFW71_08750 [Actinomycetota bacterium]|nr:hypothetical protein [Actinomycetota bacterium]
MRRRARSVVVGLAALVLAACGPAARTTVSATSPPAVGALTLLDSSWTSPQAGWVLADGSCGGALCAVVLHTTDRAATWRRVAAPADPSLTGLRFVDGHIGYAMSASAVYLTTDGARTWHRVGAPALVEDLETSGRSVVLVGADSSGCPGPCNAYVLTATAGTATWHTLPAPAIAQGVRDDVSVQGSSLVLAAYGQTAGGAGLAHTRLARSSDGGATWSTAADPCRTGPEGEDDTTAVTSAPGGVVAVLCVPRTAQFSPPFVLLSADGGATFGARRRLPLAVQGSSVVLALGAGAAGDLSVAALDGSRYVVLVSHNGGANWTHSLSVPAPSEGAAGAFVTYSDATHAALGFQTGSLWTTADGGDTWTASMPKA